MDSMQAVLKRLKSIQGIVGYWTLPDQDRPILLQLESQSNHRSELPGIIIENEGIREVMTRQNIVAISHSPGLRHPPGPVVVLCDGGLVVGEEICDPEQLEKFANDPKAIMLGTNLVLYRDKLIQAKGKQLKLTYRALRFPELEQLRQIQDVVSITVSSDAHRWLAQKMGRQLDDSNVGTVLIGFNESDMVHATRRKKQTNESGATP